jgi:hypothetical protein
MPRPRAWRGGAIRCSHERRIDERAHVGDRLGEAAGIADTGLAHEARPPRLLRRVIGERAERAAPFPSQTNLGADPSPASRCTVLGMPRLRHLAVCFALLAAFARPAPPSALLPTSPEARVGGIEVAAQLLAGEFGAASRDTHQGFGAAYDENASGYRVAAGGADDAVRGFCAVSRAEADDIARHGFRSTPVPR